MICSPRPVDVAADLRAYGQRPVAQVGDDTVLLVYIQHAGLAQRAVVGGLTAALRIKSTLIQNNSITFLLLSALYYGCGEFFFIYIFIV